MNAWITLIVGFVLGLVIMYLLFMMRDTMACEFNEMDTETDRRGPSEEHRMIEYLEENEGMLMFNQEATTRGWGYVKADQKFWAAGRTVREVLRRAIQREIDDAHMAEVSE